MTWLSDTSSERMMVPERVVIGEAVALEVTAASVGARILSGLIDYALYTLGGIVTLLLWLTLYVRLGEPGSAGSGVLVSLVVLCWMVVVPVAVETLSRGRSAGRMVTGTRVVRDDGTSLSRPQARTQSVSWLPCCASVATVSWRWPWATAHWRSVSSSARSGCPTAWTEPPSPARTAPAAPFWRWSLPRPHHRYPFTPTATP